MHQWKSCVNETVHLLFLQKLVYCIALLMAEAKQRMHVRKHTVDMVTIF